MNYNTNEKFNNHMLSSLVMNTPDRVDTFTTAPKFTKTLPFEIKIDSQAIANITFKLLTGSIITMVVSCIAFCAIFIPTQADNNQLLNTSQKMTNQQLILHTKAQEASTYKKLFATSQAKAFTEPKEIIVVNNYKHNLFPETNKKKPINIQFSGF